MPDPAQPSGESPPPLAAGACDCHTHVFADPGRFPMAASRTYTPELADTEQLRGHLRALGLSRVVVVQPSIYGTDNAALLDALATLGPDVARGVAVIDPHTISAAELRALADAGVCGIRLNLETHGVRSPDDAQRLLRAGAERVGPLGWHLQVHARLALVDALRDVFPRLGVPVVLDHYAGTAAGTAVTEPAFARLLHALDDGSLYVKLSAGHLCGIDGDDFEPLAPLARALAAARPDRLVWGSDWPHPDPGHAGPGAGGAPRPLRHVDDRRSLAMVRRCVRDADEFDRILVHNPRQLYGFAAPA